MVPKNPSYLSSVLRAVSMRKVRHKEAVELLFMRETGRFCISQLLEHVEFQIWLVSFAIIRQLAPAKVSSLKASIAISVHSGWPPPGPPNRFAKPKSCGMLFQYGQSCIALLARVGFLVLTSTVKKYGRTRDAF